MSVRHIDDDKTLNNDDNVNNQFLSVGGGGGGGHHQESLSSTPNKQSTNDRKHSSYSQRSHESAHDRRLSFLQSYGQHQQQQHQSEGKYPSGGAGGFTQKGLQQQQQQQQYVFRPFTRESLAAIKQRITEEKLRKAQKEVRVFFLLKF